MAGYIGSKASVVTPGAERKKVFAITTTTTSLTGLNYTVGFVHVFHNGIRLVDGTDYTATSGTSITLTNAAETGDEVVVVSYGTFTLADAYTKAETYTKAEADSRYVNAAGDLTLDGNAIFGDNEKAIFGDGSDLQIYHDGSHSYIDDAGTGDLRIRADNLLLKSASGEDYITATANGSVSIAYDNATKLATTSTGVTVTGTVSATSFAGDGSALTGLPSSAPSTAQVLSATAGASAGAVGTYAYLGTTGNAEVLFGSNYAGSGLIPAAMSGDPNQTATLRLDGSTQSGTWKGMGQKNGAFSRPYTLYLRIA